MTSSLRRNSRPAFTLIELLVVIGIIVLLATIALGMISRAMMQAKRTQMSADLAAISQALEAYRADFGDYPRRRTTDVSGASLLCWALIAPGPAASASSKVGQVPGDGNDGPGFRLRGTTGTVKGPYLAADRFNIGIINPGSSPIKVDTSNGGDPIFDNRNTVIADRYLHPILYFPANKNADPHNGSVSGGAFVNNGSASTMDVPNALFNYADTFNDKFTQGFGIKQPPNVMSAKVMAFRMGNIDGSGTLNQTDAPVTTGPYLLWSPGPDEYYGTDDDVADNGSSVQLNTGKLPPNILAP